MRSDDYRQQNGSRCGAGEHGRHQGGSATSSQYAPWVKYAVAGTVVLFVVLCVFAVRAFWPTSSGDAGEQSAAQGSSAASSSSSKSKKKKDAEDVNPLDSIPATSTAKTFSLNGGKAPAVTHGELADLKVAIANAEQQGSVGIVFYDLSSGKGIAYNADAAVYGASSIKAPYVLYICESLVETGQVDLDKRIEEYDKGTDMVGLTVRELIERAIVDSDNDSFVALRSAFDSMGYDDWAKGLGAEDASSSDDGDFPTYCARSSAKLWTEMDTYLRWNTDTSKWLASKLSSTAMSFIRSGLSQDATVYDKAGWIDEEGYEATCDAGIVAIDGHSYVISIMTSMPWSDETSALVSQIASDLVDVRSLIA